jgi:glutathione S-transferase
MDLWHSWICPDGMGVRAALAEHLEARWPEPPLFPARIGREILRRALGRVNSVFGPHLPGIARGTPEQRVRALRATERFLRRMDRTLPSESGFLLNAR